MLPQGYGVWDDWNCPVNIELEKQMTEENELLWKFRGPNPSHVNTPEVWNGIPFNYQKGVWGFRKRTAIHQPSTAIQQPYSSHTTAMHTNDSAILSLPQLSPLPPFYRHIITIFGSISIPLFLLAARVAF